LSDDADPNLTATLVLIQRAQGGDNACRDRLIERYYDRVRRIVRIRMDSPLRKRLDSGDILQETFMAAMRGFDKFDMGSEASFINWLAVIAERKVRDALDHATAQRRDVRREVEIDGPRPGKDEDDRAPDQESPNKAVSPLSKLAMQEDSALLEEALHSLPEQYRELILLRDYAGYSWDEVARETGRPNASAARMMHARAMVELSMQVQKGGGV